jgi:hypothetical protein
MTKYAKGETVMTITNKKFYILVIFLSSLLVACSGSSNKKSGAGAAAGAGTGGTEGTKDTNNGKKRKVDTSGKRRGSVTSAGSRKDIRSSSIGAVDETIAEASSGGISLSIDDTTYPFYLCTYTKEEDGQSFSYFYTAQELKAKEEDTSGAATESGSAGRCIPSHGSWKVSCQSCEASQKCTDTAWKTQVDIGEDSDPLMVAYNGVCADKIAFRKYAEKIYDNNKEAISEKIAEIEEKFLETAAAGEKEFFASTNNGLVFAQKTVEIEEAKIAEKSSCDYDTPAGAADIGGIVGAAIGGLVALGAAAAARQVLANRKKAAALDAEVEAGARVEAAEARVAAANKINTEAEAGADGSAKKLANAELKIAQADLVIEQAAGDEAKKQALKTKSDLVLDFGGAEEDNPQKKALVAEQKVATAKVKVADANGEDAKKTAVKELEAKQKAKVQADLEVAIDAAEGKPIKVVIVDPDGKSKTVRVTGIVDGNLEVKKGALQKVGDFFRGIGSRFSSKISINKPKPIDIAKVTAFTAPKITVPRLSQEELTEEGFNEKLQNFCLAVKNLETVVAAAETEPAETEPAASE